IGCSSKLSWWPPSSATAARTRRASCTTSGPIPSPGNRTIVDFISWTFRNGFPCRRGGAPETMLDAVCQRGERGFDDAGRCSDRGPLLGAAAVVDQHARDRRGAVAAVEDADLVVVEPDRRDLGVGAGQRLAERGVDRVDRAVALG